jgi:DNA-damage-inducible protein D
MRKAKHGISRSLMSSKPSPEVVFPNAIGATKKKKLTKEGIEVYDKIVRLKRPAEDGKMRETDVADTEALLRLIQSIPSPKTEPFKQWLAKV